MTQAENLKEPLSEQSQLTKDLGFYFSKILASNLEYWKNSVIHEDWDMVGIVDGRERSGKSTIAQQIASYLDVHRELFLSRIVFNADEFMAATKKLPKGSVIIWDESRLGLGSATASTLQNKIITQHLTEMGQYNLFVILVLNSFYDLNRYSAVWRAQWLVHTYIIADTERKRWRRGHYMFYNRQQMINLYQNDIYRRFYKYPRNHASFTDKFPKKYIVDETEYRAKKLAANTKIKKESEKQRAGTCPECGKKPLYTRRKDGVSYCATGHTWRKEADT